MGALADLTDEFKKLPTAGKVAVVGAGGAVVVLTVIAARHSAANNSGSSLGAPTDATGTSGGADLSGTTAGGTSDVMFSTIEAQLQAILAAQGGAGQQPIPPQPSPGTGASHGKPIPPQPAPKHTPSYPRIYIVKPGDSLSSISYRYPVHGAGNWQAIYNLNRATIGSNPNLIKPGQRLKLY